MQNDAVTGVKKYIICLNLEQSRIQSLSSCENEPHHTMTPVFLQMIQAQVN